MSEANGRIELERRVDSITVGRRHHREVGDLKPLTDSIQQIGLLQPVTITPEGVLICGYRRLTAVKRLGWSTLRVWVRSGLSDELSQLLAQHGENATHKPLAALEAAALYKEMKTLLTEDAARRKRDAQFGATRDETAGHAGGPDSGPPQHAPGKVSRQAALMVTQTASHARLEQICEMERIAAGHDQPPDIRQLAEDEVELIRNGGAVDPSYQRVKAAVRLAALRHPAQADDDLDTLVSQALARAKEDRARRIKENRARRAAAAENAKRSLRSFGLMWAELDGWSKHYDAAEVARDLKEDDWALFLRVLDETKVFAESVSLAREYSPT